MNEQIFVNKVWAQWSAVRKRRAATVPRITARQPLVVFLDSFWIEFNIFVLPQKRPILFRLKVLSKRICCVRIAPLGAERGGAKRGGTKRGGAGRSRAGRDGAGRRLGGAALTQRIRLLKTFQTETK